MTIDIHTHFHSKALEGKAGKLGPTFASDGSGKTFWQIGSRRQAAPKPIYNVGERLRKMDEAEVDMHILATSPKWYLYNFIHDADPSTCVDFSRVQNDDLMRIVKAHPRRFAALATLPFIDMAASLKELDRVADLGMRGVIIDSTINGMGLDSEELFPVYEKLERYGMPMLVHPSFLPDPRVERNGYRWMIGFLFDETYSIACLVVGGVLDQFPHLKVVVSHGGGATPYAMGRLIQGVAHRADVAAKCKHPFEYYLKKIYYDACLYNPAPLQFLHSLVGEDNILFGTNYPGSPGLRPTDIQALGGVTEAAKQKMVHENAKKLFSLDVD